MAKGISQPWLIVGDFNAILSTKDRLAGVLVTNNEIKDFGDCVRDMGVNELQWTGNYYTWTNKQCGKDRISSRIDRAFGNDEWMDKWGNVNVDYGNPSISDHSSMMIILQKTQQHGKGSFKFFNVWTEHESFMEMVETIWKKEYGYNKMKQVWCKLKDLQHVLKKLNRKDFKYIGKQIDMARIEIANEKELLIKLEKWSLIEESALRQKSRIKWIQLGDANNKEFKMSLRCSIRAIWNFNRLHGVIQSIICDSQAGFVPGRKIADNLVLAHELVKAYTRKHMSPRSMLKIDMQKAYDLVEWDYLEQTSQSFDAAKGLRQGDPMSPFLFAIAMEYLNDLLMLARGDLESVKAIQLCFCQFSQASGLQANLSKSSIYCGGVQQK
ncbi:uncharacterized protein [Solanum lycopersicum]|uniref:uncharacterized protein n=1 Tax=Solanum lycopersicum TaxID=4081 RepID=UPI0037483BDA